MSPADSADLRRRTPKTAITARITQTVFLCVIMQLAAFLCVICVICGRITRKRTQAINTNETLISLPYNTQEDLIYLRENNQIRILYQSARTPMQINSDDKIHFTLSNVTKKESYSYGLNIKKASPLTGKGFRKTHTLV